MSSIKQLLRRPSPETIKRSREPAPDLISLEDEDAGAVCSALASENARTILTGLYDQPRTASEVADEIDTSVQNANYHLENLLECGLIEVAETWYSAQGREMKVYAPTNRALVLFAGDDVERSSLRDALKRVVGFVGAFAGLSLVVDRLAQPMTQDATVGLASVGVDGGQSTLVLSPGTVFFVGSVLAVVGLATWWHLRTL